ncbi:unnamed protein product [Clonostachys rosea f. rosea IK726]|uniref:DNA-directed RNA polymerase II subunit RPB9-like zinc ribbon domain-containing protein n=2 Tax=Bionectria ochroleuca TaxID=29856 RepID=A0A0B7JZH4_BIOOC|nr:unnamed protein product [Clonostachys rosea f. rosea IK726]
MSSPNSNASHDAQMANKPKKLEQISFRFCSECSNMLYPKEDEDAHKLQFTCRTCQYTEDATTTCVFRNVLNETAGETAGVTQDVGSDPTVSAFPPALCFCCGTIVYCTTCGDSNSEMAVEYCKPTAQNNVFSSCNLSVFQMTLWDEDEYDEEMMSERSYHSTSSELSSDSHDDDSSCSTEI